MKVCLKMSTTHSTEPRIRRADESEAAALTALALTAKQHWGYAPKDIERWRPDLRVTGPDIASKPTFVVDVENGCRGPREVRRTAASAPSPNTSGRPHRAECVPLLAQCAALRNRVGDLAECALSRAA